MPTDTYLPIVDVSEHQGSIDFQVMRDRGVEGVIIRICHGLTLDKRFDRNWRAAQDVFGDNVGAYPFINPKRGNPRDCTRFLLDHLVRVNGDLDTFIMFDVESYKDETPNRDEIWEAPRFSAWLVEHIDETRIESDDVSRLIGYSNASFWNPWVGDRQLAAELKWIVPRYPVYPPATIRNDAVKLAAWVLQSPKPPDPAQWAPWAFSKAAGPFPPAGADGFEGWQFSAGWNRQGQPYGCQSSDLDLNIVRAAAWDRWTRREEQLAPPIVPPPVVEEPVMPYVFKLANGGFGIRDVTGARPLNGGELEGPYAEERVWDIPGGSNWEAWVKRELARYERDLNPPAAPAAGGPVTVTIPSFEFVGRADPVD